MKQAIITSIISLLILVAPAASAQLSYRFDDSVIYLPEQKRFFARETAADIDTDWDSQNGSCLVAFLPHRVFETTYGTSAIAQHRDSPSCRIDFNAWYFLRIEDSKFLQVLKHELLHAYGVQHSADPNSLMYKDYRPGQELKTADRFALWIAQRSPKGKVLRVSRKAD